MKKRLFLFIMWAVVFITEMEILIANPSELSGLTIYTCCLLAALPIFAMANELHNFKKNQKRRTT
jgi:hypothetical protein